MTTAEFARSEGFASGLSAALAMAQRQATHEPWLGQVALDHLASALRERISAGGCPTFDERNESR